VLSVEKTNEPQQDSQNRLRLHISEGYRPFW